MTDIENELIKRCERQAVYISDLERELRAATDALRVAGPNAEMALLRGLARASVNCGRGCHCYLANDVLNRRGGATE